MAMTKKSQIMITLFIMALIQQSLCHYECNHKGDYKPIINHLKFPKEQLLQQSTPAPIRITFDDTEIQSINNPQLKKLLLRAVKGAEKFYEDLIIVKQPHQDDLIVQDTPQDNPCNNHYFKNYPKQKNSDFHFYIKLIEIEGKVIATSSACQLNEGYDNRPDVAVINFNTLYISSLDNDFYNFQKILKITIHELFHAIAFSPSLYGYFKNQQGKYENYSFSFPHVLEWAKSHYGCDELTQYPIEANGEAGSKGAHWSRDLLNNDVNTASYLLGNMVWSGANNALLLDSGWYDISEIEKKSEPIQWGAKKGCEFLKKETCNLEIDEFCLPESKQSFTYSGLGVCSSQKQNSDDFATCPYVVLYSNQECQNPKNNSQDANKITFEKFNVVFGSQSAAFQSNLTPGNYKDLDPSNIFCYKYKCVNNPTTNDSEIQISFDKDVLTCQYDGQILNSPKYQDFKGRLVCPKISDFCKKQLQCEDFCSQNGYCLNGKCHCIAETYGDKCECSSNANLNQPSCLLSIPSCKVYTPETGKCQKCYNDFNLDSDQTGCDHSYTFASHLSISILVLALSLFI